MNLPRQAALGVALALLAGTVWASDVAPRRIVTLAPSLTETVFALGCGNRVVGVGDYDRWPAEVAGLPRVGGLYNPNLERLLGLRPDLVLIPSPMAKLEAACGAAGIRVERVAMESVAETEAGIRRLAGLLGRPEAGERLAARVGDELAAVARRTAGLPRPKVLLVLDRPASGELRGLVAAGPGTFLNELLVACGGRNVFADAPRRYFTPSLEEIARRRPELILELDVGAGDADALERAARARWAELFAPAAAPVVKVLTDATLVVPGPRLGTAASRLAGVLHPGAEGDR